MTIAYLFDRFPSPTETFLSREVAALRAAGVQIEVFALEAGTGARPIAKPAAALKLGGKTRFWRATGEKLGAQLKELGVSHVHAAWANHVAEIAQHAAQSAALPWSFAAHARDLWVEGGDLKSKLASAQFGAVCTRAGQEELLRHGENVIYAPHGLPLRNFPFQDWEKPRVMRVIGVGRLVEKKGWMDLVAAAALRERLERRGAGFRCEIVGEGPLRGLLEKQIASLGLQDIVTLRGALPQGETLAAMQAANCLILPSRRAADGDRDGLPNVLLEAAALGVPIVTTSAGSATDLVDESTGVVIEPGDLEALSAAIGRVFMNGETTQNRCRAARARVEAEFDVEKNVRVLADAFNSIS